VSDDALDSGNWYQSTFRFTKGHADWEKTYVFFDHVESLSDIKQLKIVGKIWGTLGDGGVKWRMKSFAVKVSSLNEIWRL